MVFQWRKHKLKIPENLIENLENEYDAILTNGFIHHRRKKKPPLDSKKLASPKVLKKRTIGLNLFNRLQNRKQNVLAFLPDTRGPFTNKRAERDLRMKKLKQKISGSFRSHGGVTHFCRIRTYISSCKKQSYSPLEAVENALKHRPIILTH